MTFHRSICAIVSQKLIVEHRYLLASPRISIGNSGHSSGARARHFIRDCSNDKFSSSYGGDINFVVRHPMSTLSNHGERYRRFFSYLEIPL